MLTLSEQLLSNCCPHRSYVWAERYLVGEKKTAQQHVWFNYEIKTLNSQLKLPTL